MPEKPDTLNKFLVSVHSSGQIAVLNPPLQARASVQSSGQGDSMPRWPAIGPLSPADALNLAAWLVVVAHGDGTTRADFDRLLDAIEST